MSQEPEVTTPVVAAPETAAQAPAPEAQGSPSPPQSLYATPVHEELARSGVDVSHYQDHATLARDFIQNQQIADHYHRNIAPYLSEFQQWQQSKNQPATAPPTQQEQWNAEQYFEKQWGGPKHDPKWWEYVQRGTVVRDEATGMFTVDPKFLGSVPQEAVDGLNRLSQWYQPAARDFIAGNPLKRTWEAFQEPLEKWFSEKFGGTMQSYMARLQDDVATREFEKQNFGWLVQHNEVPGPDGKPIQVPVQQGGQYQLSPFGQRFVQLRDHFQQRGFAMREAIEEANARLQGEVALAQQSRASAQPAPVPAQPQSFLANAAAASHGTPGPAGKEFETWGQLDGIFTSAARQAGHLAQ